MYLCLLACVFIIYKHTAGHWSDLIPNERWSTCCSNLFSLLTEAAARLLTLRTGEGWGCWHIRCSKLSACENGRSRRRLEIRVSYIRHYKLIVMSPEFMIELYTNWLCSWIWASIKVKRNLSCGSHEKESTKQAACCRTFTFCTMWAVWAIWVIMTFAIHSKMKVNKQNLVFWESNSKNLLQHLNSSKL